MDTDNCQESANHFHNSFMKNSRSVPNSFSFDGNSLNNSFFTFPNDCNTIAMIEDDYKTMENQSNNGESENPIVDDIIDENHWQNESIFNQTLMNFNTSDDETNFVGNSTEKINDSQHLDESIIDGITFSQTFQSSQLTPQSNNLDGEITPSPSFPCAEVEFNDWSQEIRKSLEKNSDENYNNHENERAVSSETSNETNSSFIFPDQLKSLVYRIKGINSLYDWQVRCLNLKAVEPQKNLIYAVPTSGGKTLVAEILMLKEVVCHKKNAIFILPFIAIVQEKIQSMTPFAVELDFLLEEYAACKGQYPPLKRRKKKSIYICTIEKALGLINSLIETKRLDEIGMVVVDELHLIGENGGRGACLEVLLTKLMFAMEKIPIVGMSATIGNLNEIAQFLKADLYTEDFRPVELTEYVKCGDRIWQLNPKNEDIFHDEKIINYPYSQSALQLDPDKIGGLVMDVVPKDSCLIFCSTKKNCENIALLMTRVLFRTLKSHKKEEKQTLLTALRRESVICPILERTIEYGVAYHHSGLIAEERRLIEDAYRDGVLCVICATSTLAAGVNLPARRVILRSPYIGNQFMNLSKYKQMIGRAGRAGLGGIGESILICKSNEIEKVQEMLKSKMDDCLSTLHLEIDRGINNLILSSVMLSLVSTRSEIHDLFSLTLLCLQSSRRDIELKEIIDQAVIKLTKTKTLVMNQDPHFNPNSTFDISSQEKKNDSQSQGRKPQISVTMESKFGLSDLGRAAMKACVDLKTAHILAEDLRAAQKHLILKNNLHLLFFVTPYDVAEKMKPVGSVIYNVIMNLSESEMEVSRLLGINETAVAKIRDGITPKNVPVRVVQRFYLTLILNELSQQQSFYTVAQKYNVDRGMIQNLLSSAATFANTIVRFCQEIPELWAFTDLFKVFAKKLNSSNAPELEALMELPTVKAGRARQLYNAGYKTLQSIATAKPNELEEKIKYIPKYAIHKIITSANFLLMEKIENLKDEYAELMEGFDSNNMS